MRTFRLAGSLWIVLLCSAARGDPPDSSPQLLKGPFAPDESWYPVPRAILDASAPPVIDKISFVGLRRIPPETLLDKMVTRTGEAFSSQQLAHDVHTLGRLGWFDTVRVEIQAKASGPAFAFEARPDVALTRVQLTVFAEELPFLTSVRYSGSRLLSGQQIDKLLAEKKLTPKSGEPENRFLLHRIATEIEAALQELGHPEARAVIHEQFSERATVDVRFEIAEGPHLALSRVAFFGNPQIPAKRLRRQMHELRPDTLFAGLRGKNSYTPEGFAADRQRLLDYYRNHGYPEARVGDASVWQFTSMSHGWRAWRHKTPKESLALLVPIEAGRLYKIESVTASDSLANPASAKGAHAPSSPAVQPGAPYSPANIENLRRAWQAQIRRSGNKSTPTPMQTVDAVNTPDSATKTVRVHFRLSDAPPYTVRHLQFQGIRRFPDAYFRKRIALKEGAPLDDRALELGLTRLARTGYFKPIKKEDVHVQTNDATHTADVTIHIEELGLQRISLSGGRGQFGSTLGIAYTLFNLLDREELLATKIESGPEMLQIAFTLAKEGFLGSRGTLALSIFDMFLRPALTGTVKGPFYNQHTVGMAVDYSYALTPTDTLSLDYGLSRSNTQYSLALPPGLTGLPATNVSANTSSRSLGMGWERNTGYEQIKLADSVSGGLLGGSENLLRAKTEYGRIFRDSLFNSHNAWAFHASFSAAGSYSGNKPVYARAFAGDQFVRGLRDGELGPDAVSASVSSSGSAIYSATPAGANAIGAFNAEYRVPMGARTEAATFFDLGSGRLLPNWLGPTRPSLIDATNGFLHGSTGIELRWSVPGVNIPVRLYYALNVLRLNRAFTLPDGSLFRARNRFSALGWGLGTMF